MLTLYQPIDPELVSAISGLKALGVTTTVMLDVENEQSIEFVSNPNLGALIGDKTVLASEYSKRESDIINEYERYSAYVGFDIDEYTAIIKRMREDGAKVAVFGIANEYNKLMAVADITISCDTVRYASEKYRESIYERLPAEGRDTDTRASQQTRLLSKVTVRRAHANGGGVSSVLTAVRTSRSAYVSLAQSVVLFLMLMSTLVPFAVMTVLTGNILIDPIQMVLLSSTFALLSATVFAEFEQSSKILSAKMDFTRYPFETVRGAIPGMIARASVVAASAVAIKILDVIGVFGEKASYTLPIFVCIALTLFFEVFLFAVLVL